jgi:hypothetical protein
MGCNNNGPNVGITSTPVIDPGAGILYAIAYKQLPGGPAYYLHALDLGSLTDKVAPRLIAASHTLANGSAISFNAAVERQRPGLLLANGNIYAGFGSFCDQAPSQSRGWLLGWQAATLAPLRSNQVLDDDASAPLSVFLSSIWMSGYGLAADYAGNVLFVTGNSDYSGTTYNGFTNIQESVVKVSPDLTAVIDLFTPYNQSNLDQVDADFGAGGVMLLPPQPGPVLYLAAAAGKDGNMFLLNASALGGYSAVRNNVLGAYPIGGCYCGASYFEGAKDGTARVVSSGGKTVNVWKLETSPSPALSLLTSSVPFPGKQRAGFFTSVSSNGTSNPIIWAISRRTIESGVMYLYAYDPEIEGDTMPQLFKDPVGEWPNLAADANLVPVVANGKVYVAGYRQLLIFGPKAAR